MPHFRQTNIFDETNQNQIISEIAFPRNKSTMGFKLISNLILLMVHDLNRGTKGWDEKSNEGKNSKEEKSEGLKIQRTKVLQGNEIILVWGTQDWGTKGPFILQPHFWKSVDKWFQKSGSSNSDFFFGQPLFSNLKKC